MFKKCYKCGEIKDVSEFGKNKSKKDGLRTECKKCHCEMTKKYIVENSEKIKERSKKFREDNKEKIKLNKKKYYYNGGGKEKSKEWCLNNIELIRTKTNIREKKRRDTDSLFKLKNNIRNLINKSFKWKGMKKNGKTISLLGCSFEEFKLHLESQFEPWMNWNNHSRCTGKPNETWNIDHIIPLDTAKTEEDIIRLNHYTNLQPLCSYINVVLKKNKYEN